MSLSRAVGAVLADGAGRMAGLLLAGGATENGNGAAGISRASTSGKRSRASQSPLPAATTISARSNRPVKDICARRGPR